MKLADLKGKTVGVCVSGGLDSTLALLVAAEAMKRLSAGSGFPMPPLPTKEAIFPQTEGRIKK